MILPPPRLQQGHRMEIERDILLIAFLVGIILPACIGVFALVNGFTLPCPWP